MPIETLFSMVCVPVNVLSLVNEAQPAPPPPLPAASAIEADTFVIPCIVNGPPVVKCPVDGTQDIELFTNGCEPSIFSKSIPANRGYTLPVDVVSSGITSVIACAILELTLLNPSIDISHSKSTSKLQNLTLLSS